MKAAVGDRIDIHGKHVGDEDRLGEIVDVRGPDGTPPYVVQWADGHRGLFFPGPDATLEHPRDDQDEAQ